jgi:hypothetical protein
LPASLTFPGCRSHPGGVQCEWLQRQPVLPQLCGPKGETCMRHTLCLNVTCQSHTYCGNMTLSMNPKFDGTTAYLTWLTSCCVTELAS